MDKKNYLEKESDWLTYDKGNESFNEYEKILVSGISNPRMLEILEDVKNIWHNFRPTLISLSCEAVGGDSRDTIVASLMVTLAGAGIGIHDDIIDKSEAKRFGKTIPSLYDDDEALLIGDLLLVKGLTVIEKILEKPIAINKIKDIIKTVQKHYFEICEGVFMEKNWRNNISVNLDFCNKILWKYGSDGEACTTIGAILGNGTKKEIEALANYGRRLCYVFRLAEEVKDTLDTTDNLLRRLEYETIPIPILFAFTKLKPHSSNKQIIFQKYIKAKDTDGLLKLCIDTEAFDYVRCIAQKEIKKGLSLLKNLRDSNAKNLLSQIICDSYPHFF